jgi:hypothetical protein
VAVAWDLLRAVTMAIAHFFFRALSTCVFATLAVAPMTQPRTAPVAPPAARPVTAPAAQPAAAAFTWSPARQLGPQLGICGCQRNLENAQACFYAALRPFGTLVWDIWDAPFEKNAKIEKRECLFKVNSRKTKADSHDVSPGRL